MCSFFNGITNNQGLFTLYDVSVSTNTTFTATYTTVTDSVTIYICDFIDYGVSGNASTDWVALTSGTKTVGANATTLSNNNTTRYDIFANLNSASSVYDFEPPFTIEMDVLNYVGDSSNYARLQIYDNVTREALNTVNSIGNWKVTYDGAVGTFIKNNEVIGTYERNMQNCRIGFIINKNSELTYRNFAIY